MEHPHAAGQGTIRVGIVGANPDMGWGSGVHRRVVDRLSGFKLQGVCTTRRETAERAAKAFGAPLFFTARGALHSRRASHEAIPVDRLLASSH